MIIALMHLVQRDQWNLWGVMVWLEIRHGHTAHRYLSCHCIVSVFMTVHPNILCSHRRASKHIVFTQTNNVARKLWVNIIEVCACTESVETSLLELMFCAGYWVIYCTLFHNLETSFPVYFVKSFVILLSVYENCSWWTILLSTWSVHKSQAFSLKNGVGTSPLHFLFVLLLLIWFPFYAS
jgi:hypothetical protein